MRTLKSYEGLPAVLTVALMLVSVSAPAAPIGVGIDLGASLPSDGESASTEDVAPAATPSSPPLAVASPAPQAAAPRYGALRSKYILRLDGFYDSHTAFRDSEMFRGTQIILDDQIKKDFAIHAAFELNENLRTTGKWGYYKFDFEKLLKEFYIVWTRDFNQQPVALIIPKKSLEVDRVALTLGKQRLAYGLDQSEMPRYQSSALYSTANLNELFAFTVRLEGQFLGMFNRLETSIGESHRGDLSIGPTDSFSIRASRVTPGIGGVDRRVFELSYTQIGNTDLGRGHAEQRVSVGYIERSGNWMRYFEAETLVGTYDVQRVILTGGIAFNVKNGKWVLEYNQGVQGKSTSSSAYRELGLGYHWYTKADKSEEFGPELRMRDHSTIFGLRFMKKW